MELTQEQLKTGIKNQIQEFLYKSYYKADDGYHTRFSSREGHKYVMRPETENFFVADSTSFEVGLKELLKISQPMASELTTIRVGVINIDETAKKEKIQKIIDEVNSWQEKGYSNVKVVYDEEATAKLKKEVEEKQFSTPYKIAMTVNDEKPLITNFEPAGSTIFESDYSKKMGWMQEYVDQYASKPAVIAESFISRTLDWDNKNRVFEELAKKQAIYEAENSMSSLFKSPRDRCSYGEYCEKKLVAYFESPFSMPRRHARLPGDDPDREKARLWQFYIALGEVGPNGTKELILQEHLRWNVNYLAEGVVFGPKKDLEGTENGVKTSPWIVSAEELWERSQKREVIPVFERSGRDYIAYGPDAKMVRDSMGYDLDGFAELCDYGSSLHCRSRGYFDTPRKDGFDVKEKLLFDDEMYKLDHAYLSAEVGFKEMAKLENEMKEFEASRKNQKISTPGL